MIFHDPRPGDYWVVAKSSDQSSPVVVKIVRTVLAFTGPYRLRYLCARLDTGEQFEVRYPQFSRPANPVEVLAGSAVDQ